jgi:hypothetical protein
MKEAIWTPASLGFIWRYFSGRESGGTGYIEINGLMRRQIGGITTSQTNKALAQVRGVAPLSSVYVGGTQMPRDCAPLNLPHSIPKLSRASPGNDLLTQY